MTRLAEIAGIDLGEWQSLIGDVALEVDDAGRWLHRLVVFLVSRQNGKSVVLKARIILGLFGLGEGLILHTAQDRTLPREIFEDLRDRISDTPALHRHLARGGIRDTNGQERIKLRSGARYVIKAPRPASFRGPSADLIIVDEIREQHNRSLVGAALPAQSAVGNAQLWMTSNAGTLESVELAVQQERGRAAAELPGSDPDIAYLEWSAHEDRAPGDIEGWVEANPELGRRIAVRDVELEQKTLAPIDFETERLCRTVIALSSPAIPSAKWAECGGEPETVSADELPRPQAAIHVNGEQTVAELAMVTKRGGRLVADVVARWADPEGIDLRATAEEVKTWLEAFRVRELAYDRRRSAVIADICEDAGTETVRIDATEYVIASRTLFDSVRVGQLLHPNNPELNDQIGRAGRRSGRDETWYISEPASKGDITGVVALAFAVNLAYRASDGEGGFRWMQ